jgi:cardiolipin synthase
MKSLIYAVCIIYFINLFFAAAVVFMERKDPTATFAWVLVLLILPGFGFFFIFCFHRTFIRKNCSL